ncbi:uncharacterized protein ZBAI_02350 [Zygosaccharomyces bailii ISA1307]|nr:uncharacterized protein ZBAI_02350 [Zygosaccharomyces bailii ISA1307]
MEGSNDSHVGQSEDGESSYASSSSSEQEMVPLERPLFLKRRAQSRKEDNGEAKKRQVQLQRLQYENQTLKARQDAQNLIGANYSSEQEVLRRALMLDDNDSKDAELERQLWTQREEARRRVRRDRLVARQLELEAYEANKLKTDERLFDRQEQYEIKPQELKPRSRPNRNFRPGKARDTKFGTSNVQAEDTEYSVL